MRRTRRNGDLRHIGLLKLLGQAMRAMQQADSEPGSAPETLEKGHGYVCVSSTTTGDTDWPASVVLAD